MTLSLRRQVLQAQTPKNFLNVRHFQPTMDAQGLTVTERSLGLKTGDINLSLFVDSSNNTIEQSVRGQSFLLVDQINSAQISLAVGLWGHVTLGVSQPLHLIQGDWDGKGVIPAFAEDGLGLSLIHI